MKHLLYCSIMLLVLFSACGTSPALEAAISTPTLVDTVEPTLTPLPSDTPIQIPTATPNKTATAAAKATATSASGLEELDILLADTDIPYQDGHLLWKQNKPLLVNMRGQPGITWKSMMSFPHKTLF